ncbi:excinuclease ABC subunit UvrB [Candidatus Deianiraea vastatrix]|uniref:UvrABC system protein B n=1 Tax=Candidatus Deianiraea vastatrix TaxID=2163644 RepID=A0A5B8XDD4_9RICK|nr:excinuclease ABC subunit UvrB [Candidatus Deianiraea vastatrix]QED23332.1 UvrABC system protein B [Candidatus Deianiraea vastatrix]
MDNCFKLKSAYSPAGDQITAISELLDGVQNGKKSQVLLGVTGSGKTFTIANVIQKLNRPVIMMAHNKTLAAQLYSEMKEFFPENAVEYFVSYYDYYQPEAYLPKSDTYIEKDSATNDDIERLRHSATRSLLERRDVIVVSSVSSLYGIGSPDVYGRMIIELSKGMTYKMEQLLMSLVKLQYERNNVDFSRGKFRVRGDVVEIFPSYLEKTAIRIEYFGDEIDGIFEIDGLTAQKISPLESVRIYPNSHYATPIEVIKSCTQKILDEMEEVFKTFTHEGNFVAAERIRQRTKYDVEMMTEIGHCKGIENYSRYLTGRQAGSPPPTLFEYLPNDALLIVDESHVSVPQVSAMYAGDRSRKLNLVDHGFRLPSALDNRPLTFDEWYKIKPQTIYVSATPSEFEVKEAKGEVVSQIIRPTGLLDPVCEIRPTENQVDDIINESKKIIAKSLRVIIVTLTKKMAEKLNEYLNEMGLKAMYVHSEVDTLERISILHNFRKGTFNILIGVNLLREGIDIPECGLVAIMDADKEGFLRSETSLIQLIGRAARNSEGRVILYADKITKSIDKATKETERRRKIQMDHNEKHGITPTTIVKSMANPFNDILTKNEVFKDEKSVDTSNISQKDLEKLMAQIKKDMRKHADNLEFEKARELRDLLLELQQAQIKN